MWTSDDFPGADHVPWQLLIRARFLHEIDTIVASTVVHAVGRVASVRVATEIARAASIATAAGTKAAPEQRLAAFEAAADFEDICPPPRQWPPRPHPRWLDDLGDPIAPMVLARAADFVRAAGSDELVKTLGSALEQAGQQQG
jgi:hypothetical protein